MSSYWGLWGLHEALHRSDDGQFYANEYDENEPEHPDGPEGFWHGTPSGDLRGAHYGLHVGTYKAASEALNARIGKPAEGYWDGTRVYGETPVVSPGAGYGLGPPGDPKRVENPYDAHLPNGKATFSDGTPIPMHFKPAILPVRIKGLMANTPHEPYEDDEANDLMTERLNQGRTRHGFYYTNDGEGGYLHPKTGKWLTSISAVVPNGDHLQVLDPNWTGHHTASTDDWGLHTAADDYTWDSYDLPSLWQDYHHWWAGEEGDPEDSKQSIQDWSNVESYLHENHGLPHAGFDKTVRTSVGGEDWDRYYKHPATVAMAKLHSLAQGKNFFDDDPSHQTFSDDEVLQGAALGLLKIRRNQHNQIRTENGLYPPASTDGIRYAHIVEADVAEDMRRLAHRTAMPAPLPDDVTFHYHDTSDFIPNEPGFDVPMFGAPAVEARRSGEYVGHLYWSPESKRVSEVRVLEPHQHQSIATTLWDYARQIEPELRHSAHLSPKGRAWRDYEQSRTAHRIAMSEEDLVKMVHYTSPEKADKIMAEQKFTPWAAQFPDATDDELYNFFVPYEHRGEQFAKNYGDALLSVEVPRSSLKSDRDMPWEKRQFMVHQRDLAGRPITRESSHRTAMPGEQIHRDCWNPGDSAHFEYHCSRTPESGDFYLWKRTQRPVTVEGIADGSEDFTAELPTANERIDEGVPLTYKIKFEDGTHGTAFEDELLNHPKFFSSEFSFRPENAEPWSEIFGDSPRYIHPEYVPEELGPQWVEHYQKLHASNSHTAHRTAAEEPFPHPVLYHHTDYRNRDSIAEHGLLAEYSQANDPEYGGSYALTRPDPPRPGTDTWVIDTSRLPQPPEPDLTTPGAEWAEHSYFIPGDVPPEVLRLHRPGERIAMPTYYHHTREPDFKIDLDRKPDNVVLNRELPYGGKGLWVSPDKNHWWNYHYRGRRPYVVELFSEEDLGDDPNELFVGGDRLKNLQVKHVEKKAQAAHRTAMAWDEWAPKVNGGCESCEHARKDAAPFGEFFIDHGDRPGMNRSMVQFWHDIGRDNTPEIFISGILTDDNYRRDGVAEALMRHLHETHPGVRINPGSMTDDGQALHDRMLEKEPTARDMVTAHRTAMPTYYHHTREPDFTIDLDRKPDNVVLNRELPYGGKGLWVSPDKDHWRNYHYRGRRPYVVELFSEEDLGDDPNELFVGGDRLKNLQVKRVEKKADLDYLDLDLPATDEPTPLYRGAVIDLTSPEADTIRRSLYGKEFESVTSPDEGRHAPCRGCPHPGAPPIRPPAPGDGVQGALPLTRDFSDNALATNGRGRWSRMGQDVIDLLGEGDPEDWVDDYDLAEKMAGEGRGLKLPVLMSRHPGGDVHSVQIFHPQTKKWREILPPVGRQGSLRKTAADLAREYTDNLNREFHDWVAENGSAVGGWNADNPGDYTKPMGGPLTYWDNIEDFFKDRYPEAYRGFNMAEEKARPLMDYGRSNWNAQTMKAPPYETGPEATEKYGYDPKLLAAGMMYLHTWSHAQSAQNAWRGDKLPRDIDRLTNIFEKRQQMQRQYERQAKTAMPTVYHGTTPENAQSILRDGFKPGGWGGNAYFTTEPQEAASYGDSVLAVDLPDQMWEKAERHPWQSGHETVVMPPHELRGLKPRLLNELPRRPLSGPPGWPKVYRKHPDGSWEEGKPVDSVPHLIDDGDDLEQHRALPDWPQGTFDAGSGTYWDVDFGDGPVPVHQRELYQ